MATQSTLTLEKFLERIGETSQDRNAEISGLLEDSENMILAYVSPTGLPEAGTWNDALFKGIQFGMVKRAYDNPKGLASFSTGPGSESFTPDAGGLRLKPEERLFIDTVRGTGSGIWTLDTYVGSPGTYRTSWSRWY